MKKFFSKLPVLIIAIVLLLGSSLVFIDTMADRICKWGTYNSTIEYTIGDVDYKSESTLKAKFGNKMLVTQTITNKETGEKKTNETEVWYYRDGRILFQVGTTEDLTREEYKKAVQEIKDLPAEQFNEYREKFGYEATFKAVYLKNSPDSSYPGYQTIHTVYINRSKIPTVIVLSIIETITLVFAIVSITIYVLNKKNNKVAPTTNEQ